ncbi:MAG: PAS domain-containing protein, partial [Acidobacteria bacterium]|nr:PAS domain-containing protein [Acidobacteriota bacterium]
MSPRSAIDLPPGQNDLEIHYTALTFSAPEKARFRYRLDGHSSEWVEAGTRRVAYYSGLPPGRYRFQVAAANEEGIWNEQGASLALSLAPRFYQTTWFYGVGALALLLSGIGVNRLRVARLLRRTRELERHVTERTAEVVDQKTQLADANARLADVNRDLERANQHMRGVLNELRVGALGVGAAGVVSFVSAAAQRLLGVGPDEALGRPWQELLALEPADRARLQELALLAPPRRQKLPVRLRTADGRQYWMEIEIKDDPRQPHERIFFLYDVSEIYDLRRLLDDKAQFHGLVGQSAGMQLLFKQIDSAVPSRCSCHGSAAGLGFLAAQHAHRGASAYREDVEGVRCEPLRGVNARRPGTTFSSGEGFSCRRRRPARSDSRRCTPARGPRPPSPSCSGRRPRPTGSPTSGTSPS